MTTKKNGATARTVSPTTNQPGQAAKQDQFNTDTPTPQEISAHLKKLANHQTGTIENQEVPSCF